ncbi:MAG: hypothetical protein NZ992_02355 [Candidatus Korarchaeum sp.]|nr:hypothetical protein [Candidatus Korarchaeum sp.]MDW8036362.1 hypothetical protein [Candidatus Korarchaeum sp.]
MIPGFKVTPWEVKGERIDYERLLCDLRLKRIDFELRSAMRAILGEEHYLLERGVFFAHSSLDSFLEDLRRGSKPYIFTGRGPSGPLHLGNLIPLMLAKWLQDKLKAPLYLQVSDDEKYCLRPDLCLRNARDWARDNIAELLAFGFDEERTRVIWDTECSSWLYPASLVIAKRVRVSELKDCTKLDDNSNLGIFYYALLQSLPALMLPLFADESFRCVVPMAVDQHPLMIPSLLATRRIGIKEPAIVHSTFIPGVRGEPKMGTSNPSSAIFLSEPLSSALMKVDSSICPASDLPPVIHYLRALDPEEYEGILSSYRESREEGCELAKRRAKELIAPLFEEHARRKKELLDKVDEFLLREPPFPREAIERF